MDRPEQNMLGQEQIIQSLSRIYTSVYYIDVEKNRYMELQSVSSVHSRIGSSGNAQECLNYFCHHMMLPEYTEEMLAFVDLSTIGDRLNHRRIVSRQYRSRLIVTEDQDREPTWRQCSFIEVDRDTDGNISHVIFVTQSIQESKIEELEAKRKLQETNETLTALLAMEKQHTDIIASLSSIFSSLYLIDLKENAYQEIMALDSYHHVYEKRENARGFLKDAVDILVSKSYRPAMRIFTDFDTVDSRLGDKQIIIQEYISTMGDWIRCSFIPMEKNAEGENTKVVFGFRRITDEKKALETQDNLIQALSMAYENVYAVDMDTREATCYRMGQTISDRYGKSFAAGNYENNMTSYIENDVYEEDRHLFSRIRYISGIKQLLNDRSTYSFNYRVFRNNRIRYLQCQIVRPNCDRNEFAIAFRDVDAEIKQQAVQQKEIEDALSAVEKVNETLAEEMEIASTLSKDYPDAVLVELEYDCAVTIKLHGKMIPKEDRIQNRSYRDTWKYYIDKYVVDEDKENLRKAVSVGTVKRALKNSDEYVYSYRVRYGNAEIHHYQAVFIRIYSGTSAYSQIILGFRNVDAIVESEKRHTKIQEEQIRIIDALSREYHSLFKINANTKEISLYRTDGIGMNTGLLEKLMESGDYGTILSKYIDAFVVPEDQEQMRRDTALEVLLKEVPDVGLYKLGYRRNMHGFCSYYEMNIGKTVDDDGTVMFIMGLRDVNTEMQRRLQQAREIEAQSEIIEGLGSEYYSILLVDPESDSVTTYRAEDEDGQAIADHFRRHDYCWSKGIRSYSEELVSDNCRSEFIEKLSLSHIRGDGDGYSFTYEKLKDEGIIYLQARVAFVQEKDGKYVAVVGTRNVDDLIKKERQQEMALQEAYDAAEAANRAKTDFLSNMSHDIRTPMNGIIGMTAIAAAHLDDPERIRDCLQKITHASKHLLSLINEVLDMSKIESGKVDLIEEEFNLAELVDNLLAMTNSQIAEHHHRLEVNISGVTHEAVIGDSLRIQKIFTNLMGNAVKFTPDGGRIRLTITEKPTRQAKVGCYEFAFEDNGIGMSEEFLEQIFEPFARASDGRVNKIQGTGLGMSISRNIVRMMGGDIKVESKLGVGSKFTVTIYLKLQDTENICYDRFVDLDVLVADDDQLSLESCCGMLNDLGMKAEGVFSGTEALEQIVVRHRENRDYYACILDWRMPDMDGIETTRAIRKAVGNEVPIIIISAYDWSGIEQEAREAGANAFISKPLFRSRLARTFSALLEKEEESAFDVPLDELGRMDLGGHRALLVEDNELNAEIATELLHMAGIDVERASDGMEAIGRISECTDGYYDIIFMDIQMPVMNGYDATRAIRAMNRDYCRNIPIVAMTANAFAEDVQAARTVGMNEHIAKPLDLKALIKTLNRWLSSSVDPH